MAVQAAEVVVRPTAHVVKYVRVNSKWEVFSQGVKLAVHFNSTLADVLYADCRLLTRASFLSRARKQAVPRPLPCGRGSVDA